MGYAQRAASLADRISTELGIHPILETGDKGAFDVIADGRSIYSKAETRRMPSADLILDLLRAT
ncbi:MAG: hypothetical protein EOL86_06185 [Deltaproteobacteria bacterium]|nr:hypothetical protein [Deltaproteobacteria bacterium]